MPRTCFGISAFGSVREVLITITNSFNTYQQSGEMIGKNRQKSVKCKGMMGKWQSPVTGAHVTGTSSAPSLLLSVVPNTAN